MLCPVEEQEADALFQWLRLLCLILFWCVCITSSTEVDKFRLCQEWANLLTGIFAVDVSMLLRIEPSNCGYLLQNAVLC